MRNNLSLADSIRRYLAEPIVSGQWRAGERVPSEHELMQRFSASRMTVHGVLATLAREGLITRRRGSGSFVAERPSAHAVLTITDIASEIAASGRKPSMTVLSRKVFDADEEAKHILQIESGKVLSLTLLHKGDEAPYQLEQRFINLALLPNGMIADDATVPYGGWLLTHVPWQEAEHTIRADSAPKKTAEHLGLASGAPVLIIERRTFLNGQVLTWARLTHPASHRLVGRFKPPEI